MANAMIAAVTAASLLFLAVGPVGPRAAGGERQVLLTNNARQPIVEIYVSADGDDDWQADLLGTNFLPPGGSVLVDIDDRNGNCRVNFKTVFDDGSNHIEHGVRVCLDDDHAVSLQ
jgi:hypothetical protein